MLLERLVRNHPLPDGNKRAAFVTTLVFLEHNGRALRAADVADDCETVERVAVLGANDGLHPKPRPVTSS